MTLDQLTLDLPHRAALGAEDFLVSSCNLAAVRLIDAWPDWQDPVQLLIGPPASGKTHLARVWQARSGARALTGADLDMSFIKSAGEAFSSSVLNKPMTPPFARSGPSLGRRLTSVTARS